MSFSNYLENKLLDHLFNKSTYTPPTIYVALSTSDPGEDGSGLSEPSGGGYARVATSASDWNSASGGNTTNSNQITFPQASASWGTITHLALIDASTGGNLLASGQLNQSKTVNANDTVYFDPGDISVSLD